MTPQLSVQQLEHAIKNLQKRVDAKKLEAHSYSQFRDYASGNFTPDEATLRDATNNYLTAKLNQALIDLEELELQLKAVKQMSSGVIVPGMQITQKQR
jgi:hypothetical protein